MKKTVVGLILFLLVLYTTATTAPAEKADKVRENLNALLSVLPDAVFTKILEKGGQYVPPALRTAFDAVTLLLDSTAQRDFVVSLVYETSVKKSETLKQFLQRDLTTLTEEEKKSVSGRGKETGQGLRR